MSYPEYYSSIETADRLDKELATALANASKCYALRDVRELRRVLGTFSLRSLCISDAFLPVINNFGKLFIIDSKRITTVPYGRELRTRGMDGISGSEKSGG